MTNSGAYETKFMMHDLDDFYAEATYASFKLVSPTGFRMSISGYQANAGEFDEAGDGFSVYDNTPFGDVASSPACGAFHGSAGWFVGSGPGSCLFSNIFGQFGPVTDYGKALTWHPFRDRHVALKSFRWLIRPSNFEGKSLSHLRKLRVRRHLYLSATKNTRLPDPVLYERLFGGEHETTFE